MVNLVRRSYAIVGTDAYLIGLAIIFGVARFLLLLHRRYWWRCWGPSHWYDTAIVIDLVTTQIVNNSFLLSQVGVAILALLGPIQFKLTGLTQRLSKEALGKTDVRIRVGTSKYVVSFLSFLSSLSYFDY